MSITFSISIITSTNWLRSSLFYVISNSMVAFAIYRHFHVVPLEYSLCVISSVCCIALCLYCVEQYHRRLFMTYKNLKELQTKQSLILNLFPECFVIANLRTLQFSYYNAAFDNLFKLAASSALHYQDVNRFSVKLSY